MMASVGNHFSTTRQLLLR